MNDMMSSLLLLFVPGLPLLLAFPALRLHSTLSCYLALFPAVLLVISPMTFSIEIPWLLLGAGFGLDEISRWYLVLSIILWSVALIYLHKTSEQNVGKRFITWLLLTMSGHFGVILSTELVGFYTFSILMGYGFYGLIIEGADELAQRAGRIYLGFMILADLLLFEALLIAASTGDSLSFETVHHAIVLSPLSGLYLSVALIGFAAKIGIWPLYFWLPLVFRSSRIAVTILLSGVPVAMALLGVLRWLPLGEISSPVLGWSVQSFGAASMLYAILSGVIHRKLKIIPACVILFFTGLYSVGLSISLIHPDVWHEYGYLLHIIIVMMVIVVGMLVSALDKIKND